jgi:uncharacterized protein YcnI
MQIIDKGITAGERARRALPAAVIAIALAVPQAAGAHATVQPASSRPADLQVYTLTVPNERNVATVEVALQVPSEIDFLLLDSAPGWDIKPERQGDRIAVVRWTGGSIEPNFVERLSFVARNPVKEGSIVWKTTQRYEDGQTVRWIGPSGSDTPASTTRLSESATPTDVVSVHGDESATPAAATPSEQGGGGDGGDEGRDGLTLALAIAALVLSLAAFAATFWRRRRA